MDLTIILAANIVEIEYCPWDFHSIISCDGDQVQILFCPVPMPEVQEEIFSFGVTETELSPNSSEPNVSTQKEQGERPKFRPCPKFDLSNLDFKNSFRS